MKKTTSIDKFCTFKKETIVTNKKLKVLIPAFYEGTQLLVIEDTVKSLGVFKIIIDNKEYVNLVMLCTLELTPSRVENETIDNEDFVCLYFDAGSTFINSRNVIKDGGKVNSIYTTFIGLGKLPSFLSYEDVHLLFDKTNKLCDVNLGVSRCIFEILYAHMFRDSKDPFKFYRNTKMDNDPVVVPLHKISHGPTSTIGRIAGSYMKEGIVADLVTENTEASEIENLLRA